MDPIFKIIKYLFKKRNIISTDNTVNSFFENGIEFPKLVAIAFNIDEIRGIISNPFTMSLKNKNNQIALKFLFDNNKEIADLSPDINNPKERSNLLSLILAKQCFKLDVQEIIKKCNLIIQTKKIDNISQLISQDCILSLLNVLTDGEVQIISSPGDFDKIMIASFKKANVPLVINRTSLDVQNRFVFLIQIEIIFDCFSEKIKKLLLTKDQLKPKVDPIPEKDPSIKPGNIQTKINFYNNEINIQNPKEPQKSALSTPSKDPGSLKSKIDVYNTDSAPIGIPKPKEPLKNIPNIPSKELPKEPQNEPFCIKDKINIYNNETGKIETPKPKELKTTPTNMPTKEEPKIPGSIKDKINIYDKEVSTTEISKPKGPQTTSINIQSKNAPKVPGDFNGKTNIYDKETSTTKPKEPQTLPTNIPPKEEPKASGYFKDKINIFNKESDHTIISKPKEPQKDSLITPSKEPGSLKSKIDVYNKDTAIIDIPKPKEPQKGALSTPSKDPGSLKSKIDVYNTDSAPIGIPKPKEPLKNIPNIPSKELPKEPQKEPEDHNKKADSKDVPKNTSIPKRLPKDKFIKKVDNIYKEKLNNKSDNDNDNKNEKHVKKDKMNEKNSSKSISQKQNDLDDQIKKKREKIKDDKMKEENLKDEEKKHKKHKKHKKDKNMDINIKEKSFSQKIEELNQDILLNVLNSIGSNNKINQKLHFSDIYETIEGNNLPLFVYMFFKNEKQILDIINSKDIPLKKINDVINFLDTKEPLFKLLTLNFYQPKYIPSSAYLFYTSFLDIYFLQNSKQEIFDRCSTIIFSNIKKKDYFNNMYIEQIGLKKDPFIDKRILLDWNTYLKLLSFVKSGKNYYEKRKYTVDKYFEFIPKILNEDYMNKLKKIDNEIPNLVYYQLNYIFNYLDTKKFAFHINEVFLKAIRSLMKIKVPSFKKLAKNIRIKNVSLIYQIEKTKLIKQNAAMPMLYDEKLYDGVNVIEGPKNYCDRHLNLSLTTSFLISGKFGKKFSNKFIKSENYWNKFTNENAFDNGVILMNPNNEESKNEWINGLSSFNSKNEFISKDNSNLFFNCPKLRKKAKLYKLFQYNEKTEIWEKDIKNISEFFNDKFDRKDQKTTLVLFIDSYQNEVLSINSHLIQFSLPDFDDQNIYIYGLCEQSIELLKYNILPESSENKDLKPIFLILHVPKIKQKLAKIQNIVFKIYLFLSLVSEIQIIVLNELHFEDQINLIKILNEIKSTFNIKKANFKNLISSYSKTITLKNKNDDDFSSDGDDDSFEDENNENNENNDNDKNLLYELISSYCNSIKNFSQFIFLINNDSMKIDVTSAVENDLFLYIKKNMRIEPSHLHFINVNNPITYRNFLSSLNQFALHSESTCEEIKNIFCQLQIIDMCDIYISRKLDQISHDDLKQTVVARFNQLKNNYKSDDIENINDNLPIFSMLNNEITNSFPIIDYEYKMEIQSILDEIVNNLTKKIQTYIENELKISSENNLNYLNSVINQKKYLFENLKDIEISHINYLKNEFFEIINAKVSKNDLIMIFNNSHRILENQIQKDKTAIEDIINKFIKEINENDNHKDISLNDEIMTGTNYAIRERERENIRETKVIIENGDLESEIPQDF